MAKTHITFRLSDQAMKTIQRHQARYSLVTTTDALEDILFQFSKSQQSRIRKLLEKKPEIKRLLLSDFFVDASGHVEVHLPPEAQPSA